MTELLRPDVAHLMRRAVRVAVLMTVETGHPEAGLLHQTIRRQVELLLWKGGEQEPEPLQLLRVQDAVEGLVIVHDRDELPLRDISQIAARRQVERGRKLRPEPVGYSEGEGDPGQC